MKLKTIFLLISVPFMMTVLSVSVYGQEKLTLASKISIDKELNTRTDEPGSSFQSESAITNKTSILGTPNIYDHSPNRNDVSCQPKMPVIIPDSALTENMPVLVPPRVDEKIILRMKCPSAIQNQ